MTCPLSPLGNVPSRSGVVLSGPGRPVAQAELSCTQLQPSVASEHRTGFSRLRPIALRRASARKPHNLSLAGSGAAVPRPHRDFSFGPRSGSPARHRAGWSVHRGRSFRRLPPPAPVNRARSQSSYALEAPTIFCPVLPCGFSTAAPDTTAAKEGRERRGRNQLACAGARTRSGAAEPEPQTPGEVLAIEVCPMDRGGSQKKRHKSVANVDIISNLPDVIKDKILCYLPIKEAIRTCLLSRKWRYTWASMTELMFREDDFALGNGNEDGDSVRFASFVHTFLSLHYGPILKFEMNARRVHTFSPGGHIHRWMLILSRNGIKEIQIKTRIWRNYKIPSSFFSCAELEYACLQGCIFQLPSLFTGFKRMHTLHFIEFCATENNIGELVANCPNLEELILSRLLSFADITIHSTKLKVLRVDGMFKHLNLVTPHVSSAVINLRVNTGYVPRAGSNFNLSQFIGSLLDIENISLLGHAFECAAHGILPGKLSRLLNRLTEITLELDLGNLKEANAAHCLFQIAPNLRRMELQLMHRGYSAPTSNFWDSIDHQDCLFKNLYTVVMNNFTGSCAESGFLELLLKDATVLRSARIKDNNKLDKESLKRILKMRRASKDAEIILL